MAMNGNFETAFSGGYRIGIDWRAHSQSTSTNSSVVVADLYIRSVGSGYSIYSSANKTVRITIDGQTFTKTDAKVGLTDGQKKVLFTATKTVYHDSNGNKSLGINGSAAIAISFSSGYVGTVSTSSNVTLDKINLNSAPSLSGSVRLNVSGTIPENTGNINITWNGGSDAQNNIEGYRVYRYINGGHNGTFWPAASSFTDNIGGFGEGTSIYYKVWAYDTHDLYSGEINSPTITKNRLTGGSFTNGANISFGSTSFTLTFSGGHNTNGGTVRYQLYSDDVTVYNKAGTTGGSQTITIWKSGAYPSGPYIKFDDLKNKFKSSSYNGRLHVGLKTYNDYGSQELAGGSIGVDLRTNISVASGNTYINSNSYYNVGGGNKLIPNKKNINLHWPQASDPLGTPISYRVEYKIGSGGWSTLLSSTTSTSYGFSRTVNNGDHYYFRVIARNGYGWEKEISGQPNGVCYVYIPPSASVESVVRTSDKATVTISYSINSNLGSNGLKSLTLTYPGKTVVNTSNPSGKKVYEIRGLNETDSNSFTVTIADNFGSSVGQGDISFNGSISRFFPAISIRRDGVGVNAVPDGSAELVVGGTTKAKCLNLTGYHQRNSAGDHINHWIKIAKLRIDYQYGDAGFMIFLTGSGNGGGESTSGTLVARLKQQEPMGRAPTGSLYLFDEIATDKNCFKLIITANSASETVGEVWFKNQVGYEEVKTIPVTQYGDVDFYEQLAYTTSLPSGTQISCSSSSVGSNVLTTDNLTTTSNIKGRVAHIGLDGVMEVDKYIDFHESSTNDYNSRLECRGDNLYINGAKISKGSDWGFWRTNGGQDLLVHNKRALVGFPNGELHLGYGGDFSSIIADRVLKPYNYSGSWLSGRSQAGIMFGKQTTSSYHSNLNHWMSNNDRVSQGGLGNNFGWQMYRHEETNNTVNQYFRINCDAEILETSMDMKIYGNWVYHQGYRPNSVRLWNGSIGSGGSLTLSNGKKFAALLIGGRPSGSLDVWTAIPTEIIGYDAIFYQMTTEYGYLKLGMRRSGNDIILSHNGGTSGSRLYNVYAM